MRADGYLQTTLLRAPAPVDPTPRIARPPSRPSVPSRRRAALHPANGASVGAHFHIIIALAHYIHALAIVQRAHGFANLRDAAQERSYFFADKCFTQRFTPWAEHPGRQRYQEKQGHRDEEFPPHLRPSNVISAAPAEPAETPIVPS